MKIISYCLYGKEQIYRNGLLKNVDRARHYFPEWTVRVYVSDQVELEYLKLLERDNVEIVVKEETNYLVGTVWRMLPLEEGHEAVIIRDVDTRLFERDRLLVDDWLSTSHQFHICRDNPGYHYPIPGGLWGGRNAVLDIAAKFERWKKRILATNTFAYDLDFLQKHVYPVIRRDLVVYTEYTIWEGEQHIRRIPGERGEYEGRQIALGMQVPEDFDEADSDRGHAEYLDLFGEDKNVERKTHLGMDIIVDHPEKNMLKIYPTIYALENPFLNWVYLVVDAFKKLLDHRVIPSQSIFLFSALRDKLRKRLRIFG